MGRFNCDGKYVLPYGDVESFRDQYEAKWDVAELRSIPSRGHIPSNVVTVEFLCRHRCDVHGRTNHVVGYAGRVMCVECNPLVAREAMAENIHYGR